MGILWAACESQPSELNAPAGLPRRFGVDWLPDWAGAVGLVPAEGGHRRPCSPAQPVHRNASEAGVDKVTRSKEYAMNSHNNQPVPETNAEGTPESQRPESQRPPASAGWGAPPSANSVDPLPTAGWGSSRPSGRWGARPRSQQGLAVRSGVRGRGGTQGVDAHAGPASEDSSGSSHHQTTLPRPRLRTAVRPFPGEGSGGGRRAPPAGRTG
jgi:hypothetical protein